MKILFISLGCDKNLVDTEVMLGLLASRGYQMTDDESEADIIVINTCCFIHDAKEESIQNILEMAEYKKDGSLKALVVTGCLAERYRQEILDEIPEVDAVLGTTSYDKILEAVDGALKGKHSVTMSDINGIPDVEAKRLVTTGGHFAYLKIAEGCDKHCTCLLYTSRQIMAEQTRSLSARGSMNFPKFVTRLYFLAIFPSSRSVRLATTKSMREIHLLAGPPMSVSINRTKKGTMITLKIVSLFGKFITQDLLSNHILLLSLIHILQ